MKKILYSSLLAIASIAFVCCSEVAEIGDIQNDVEQGEESVVLFSLTANTPVSTQTKIDFTDNDTSGISLAWADGDSFSVYEVDSGAWVADFKNSAAATSVFETSDATLSDGVDYIAVYPARPNNEATYAEYAAVDLYSSQKQVGTALDLNAVCRMSDTFTVDETINFSHEAAVLTVTFTTGDGTVPTKMVYTDEASKRYELAFSEMSAADSYKAYFAVDPIEVTQERSLDFVISYGTTSAQVFSVTSTKSYEAGYRYTATIADSSTSGYTAIYTAEELIAFVSQNGANGVLMNNIELTGTQSYTAVYTGKTFNGNGYTISGLNLDRSGTSSTNAGLFNGLNAGGVVKNLTLVDPTVKGDTYVGAIAGKVANSAQILNCKVIGGTIESTGNVAGGIAGQSKGGTISGCSFQGTVTGGGTNVGGINGVALNDSDSNSYYFNCEVDATISAKSSEAGGIIGKSTSAIISNCSFTGSVGGTQNAGGIVGTATTSTDAGGTMIFDCEADATVKTSGIQAAGIVGNATTTTISNCSFSGSVSASKNAGGISGLNVATTVTGCSNSGSIDSTTTGYVAGVAANIDATTSIFNCTNSGDISVSASIAGCYAGGIVGVGVYGSVVAGCFNSGNVSVDTTIGTKVGGIVGTTPGSVIACANIGTIKAFKAFGGIVGQNEGTIVGCYNTGDVELGTGNYGYIVGYHNTNVTTTVDPVACYYIGESTMTTKKGTKCTDITTLNDAVSTMNEAIISSSCPIYIFKAGDDTVNDLPTIVEYIPTNLD